MVDRIIRLLITRTLERSTKLIEYCETNGIKAFAVPLTEQQLTDTSKNVPDLTQYSWVFFTSVTAVNITAKTLNINISNFASDVKFATVGRTTARAITTHYKKTDIIARIASSNGLAHSFTDKVPVKNSGKILWISAKNPVGELLDTLKSKSYAIDQWRIYQTVDRNRELVLSELQAVKPWDAVFFAAPSAVIAYTTILDDIDKVNCIAIGDSTARALENKGCKSITVCASPNIEDVVSAIGQSIQHNEIN